MVQPSDGRPALGLHRPGASGRVAAAAPGQIRPGSVAADPGAPGQRPAEEGVVDDLGSEEDFVTDDLREEGSAFARDVYGGVGPAEALSAGFCGTPLHTAANPWQRPTGAQRTADLCSLPADATAQALVRHFAGSSLLYEWEFLFPIVSYLFDLAAMASAAREAAVSEELPEGLAEYLAMSEEGLLAVYELASQRASWMALKATSRETGMEAQAALVGAELRQRIAHADVPNAAVRRLLLDFGRRASAASARAAVAQRAPHAPINRGRPATDGDRPARP